MKQSIKFLKDTLGIWLMICAVLLTLGSAPVRADTVSAPTPAVGMARTSDNGGYWIATQDGAVYAFGNAVYHGGANQFAHNGTVVGIVATSTNGGYWEVASDGGIFAFGDAGFHGSMGGRALNAPVVGIVATSTDQGYWLVGRDGGIFAFGDAGFHGSMGGRALNAPVVGMARTSTNGGYWEVASDGGIFAFGDAGFHGSMGGQALNAPVVGMARTSTNGGYWEVASDGGIFSFGTAQYYGNIGVVSPVPTGSAQDLAKQILSNSRIVESSAYPSVLQDLQDAAAGKPATGGYPLNPVMLRLIVAIGQSHSVEITALESNGKGHSKNSYHYTGDAVDFDRLDGQSVTGRNAPSITIINTIVPLMPAGSAFGQGQTPANRWQYKEFPYALPCPGYQNIPALPTGIGQFDDVCNHLHVQVPR